MDSTKVMDRIANCRKDLAKWKRSSNSNSKLNMQRLSEELDKESASTSPDFQKMANIKLELLKAIKEEEVYWRQKSKERWLLAGDKNTSFFHGKVKTRRMRNNIAALQDVNGVDRFSEAEKGNIAVEYFSTLFKSSNPTDLAELLEGFPARISQHMNRELVKPVTDAEIQRAAKSIKSDSAPGADGMTGKFFQHFWDITGPHVAIEVKLFFESGCLPQGWNFTQIALIPKKPNANAMTDLRPISLCSVTYKIISSILCARLKRFLPKIVSPTQGAFVSGRLISDNLLIAHEMVHGLHTNPHCKKDFLAIKTDMSKAYDRVEWGFLDELFKRMGFNDKWRSWVMTCVTSVSYTVLLNGQEHGSIRPARGLRQGDPLSPFLFILCAEALVHVMDKAEQEGRISGMRLSSKCPPIQHLLFADDSLFLCRASLRECSEFLRCLKLYGDSSGQVINFQKSSITFGLEIDPISRRLISNLLNIDKGGAGTYLGLPECLSGSKQQLLAFIGDKLNKRLGSWYSKTLSLGGKEILLKSVAMALPVYAMSCFRLTKHHCRKITSAMSSFWWNACEKKNKIHWVAWKTLCRSKQNGGLDFRDIETFNQALLAKQAWRIMNNPDSLISRLYKGRYFSTKEFLDCGKGYRPSYAWRSILFGRELLKTGLLKSIGNGNNTKVWMDKWIMDEHPRRPVNKQIFYDLELKVNSLISPEGRWRENTVRDLFPPMDAERVLKLTISNSSDRFIWAYSKSGAYSVRSGYWLAANHPTIAEPVRSQQEQRKLDLMNRCWKVKTIPKIRVFLWRSVAGALAVASRLNTRGIPVNATYNLESNLSFVLDYMEDTTVAAQMRTQTPWILWAIWKNRNSILFASKQESLNLIVRNAIEDASLWDKLNMKANEEDRNRRCSGPVNSHWQPPLIGLFKCNLNANWRNDKLHSGGSWTLRDHQGTIKYHAREAFTPSACRMVAEFRVLIWAMQSLRDLHISEVTIVSDLHAVVDAISDPSRWPRYRAYTDYIKHLQGFFSVCSFELETIGANRVAREISKSVTRDGRFQSYLAIGGPSWLHHLIHQGF
ncbi:uncharacterized protein LOC112086588 [Eutrema salsugineum]|uniref:uncharacterized protein LOC112086588 n=1 Tax=Eutrema salsugineum TaxID=72664 RepID=UPI000CED1A4D|nr:uncharacterized protein LOC112086588 [Eutrema salsugineum]